jgi:hypothetical protein
MGKLRNIQLQHKWSQMLMSVCTNVGGQVPAGMTRYFTYITFQNRGANNLTTKASSARLIIASRTTSGGTVDQASLIVLTNAASQGRKLSIALRTTANSGPIRGPVQIPKIPNNEAPLFSIAGGKYCVAMCSNCSGALFAEFFDE